MIFLIKKVSREFRTTLKSVFDKNGNCIFLCPPKDRVNSLINNLLL